MALRWWEGSMSANKTTDAVKLVLRLPKSLHRRLTQQAKRNNHSLNSEIVNQLQGHHAGADPTTELAKHVLDVLPDDVRKRMLQLIAQAGWETVVRTHDQPQKQKKAVGEK
jgi:Arc-like DNA binding dprotein